MKIASKFLFFLCVYVCFEFFNHRNFSIEEISVVEGFKTRIVVTKSLPPPLFLILKIWRSTSLPSRSCASVKNHSKTIIRSSINLCIFSRKMINHVDKSINVKDYQSPTLRCLLYISKLVLGKLDHFFNNFE